MTPAQPLPSGWCWTTLGEIADLKGGLTKGKRRKDGERLRSVPYLRVANVQRGYLDLDEMKLIEATDAEIEELRLRAGDVLFNEGGDRDKLGRGWVWQDALPECIHQNHVFRARLHDRAIEPKFVSWYANSEGAAYFNDEGKQTTNLASINLTRLSEFPLPLAPASEQRRIVAEIESQLTRLDAALGALHRTESNLARYRGATLNSGIAGRLDTARAAGDAWPWVSLAELADDSPNSITDGPFGSNLKTAHYTTSGPCVVRLQNIGEGVFLSGRACISEGHFSLLQRHRVFGGDVVIAALGKALPRACIIPDQLGPAIVKADCIRFKPAESRVSARYLCYALNSHSVRLAVKRFVHGVGRPRLNLSAIKSIRVPLPPMTDQLRIVAEIERRLSILETIEMTVRSSVIRAERLRQSILKRAFEGRLVPQHPSDEPAAQLLTRPHSNGRASTKRALRKGA